jgi:sugar lactone lactonase YvrE
MSRPRDWRIPTDTRDKLGESPLWNSATGELFWVDFYGPTIRRMAPNGARTDWKLAQSSSIGSLVFCADGRLLVALDDGLYLFDPQDGGLAPFADPNHGRPDLPYNDAKVDRHGTYWVGNYDSTESAPRGVLYSLNRANGWRIGDSGFVVCNGPTFSPEGSILYFNDSIGRRTLAYDLDPVSSRLTRRRIFHTYAEEDGIPDGCCVDASGCVWIALYGGGKVLRLGPEGERLGAIGLPARNITSCCLGGADLRTLFVTSGSEADGNQPEAGALFAIEVDCPGLAEPVVTLPSAAPPGDAVPSRAS